MLANARPKRHDVSMVKQASSDPAEEPRVGRSRGGVERARRLTPDQRSKIAKDAARARWSAEVSEAICGSPEQPLRIGEVEIECYVLDDGTRVLTQASFLEALGRHRKANVRREGDSALPPILQGKAIFPFISEETKARAQPITFRLPNGGRASGYEARLLPDVCDIYLAARKAGALPPNQEHVAAQAEVLVRGLARVGIIALVDEATGYQDFRARNALARILEAFIDKELQPWLQTFPDDFYREMFRLRGLSFPEASVQRPKYFGHLTNDVVYKRLAPGVLEELKRVTPRDEKGRPRHRYFQRLTSNVGYPKLREHLGSVVTLMKLSNDWSDFIAKLDRFHPRVGETLQLPFDDDPGTGL